MADGKFILKKIQEVLEADSGLQNLFGTRFVKISKFTPTGNSQKQITIWIDEGNSEPIFPAARAELEVTVWVSKKVSNPYATVQNAKKRILALLNREGSSISEIDVLANEGLRICLTRKTDGECEFDDNLAKYYLDLFFEIVYSEDESFATIDRGDAPWS